MKCFLFKATVKVANNVAKEIRELADLKADLHEYNIIIVERLFVGVAICALKRPK